MEKPLDRFPTLIAQLSTITKECLCSASIRGTLSLSDNALLTQEPSMLSTGKYVRYVHLRPTVVNDAFVTERLPFTCIVPSKRERSVRGSSCRKEICLEATLTY